MASKWKQGQNGLLIDPSNERVIGSMDRNGNELLFPYIQAQVATPVVILSSATNISANGRITGLTPMLYQIPDVAMVYCFAQAGLAAGFYYATFDSTSSCQLYLDAACTQQPSGITPSAYAGGTSKVLVPVGVLPGKALGANGALRMSALFSSTITAGNKLAEIQVGGQIVSSTGANLANNSGMAIDRVLRNANHTQRQKFAGSSGGLSSGVSGSFVRTVINTDIDNVVAVGMTLANATDYMVLEGASIEILPGA